MRRREELKQSQVAARENKVTLFRRYRTGELPDIQRVSMAAFLGPLGMALASCMPDGSGAVPSLHGANIIRCLCNAVTPSLCDCSMLNDQALSCEKASMVVSHSRMPCSRCCFPTDVIAASNGAAQLVIIELFRVVRTAQPAALPPVRAALALCFEREPRATAYVGALQRLAIADRGGAVEAAEVAAAAIQSGSLQCGALQVWLQTIPTVNTNVIPISDPSDS